MFTLFVKRQDETTCNKIDRALVLRTKRKMFLMNENFAKFSEKAPSTPNFGARCAQNFAPTPDLMGGDKLKDMGRFMGGKTPFPLSLI